MYDGEELIMTKRSIRVWTFLGVMLFGLFLLFTQAWWFTEQYANRRCQVLVDNYLAREHLLSDKLSAPKNLTAIIARFWPYVLKRGQKSDFWSIDWEYLGTPALQLQCQISVSGRESLSIEIRQPNGELVSGPMYYGVDLIPYEKYE